MSQRWQSKHRIYSRPECWCRIRHQDCFLENGKEELRQQAGSRAILRGQALLPSRSLCVQGKGKVQARIWPRGIVGLQWAHQSRVGRAACSTQTWAVKAKLNSVVENKVLFFQRSHSWRKISPWLHSEEVRCSGQLQGGEWGFTTISHLRNLEKVRDLPGLFSWWAMLGRECEDATEA